VRHGGARAGGCLRHPVDNTSAKAGQCAEDEPERHGGERPEHREGQRRGHGHLERARHRLMRDERGAELPVEDIREPVDVLRHDRLVEAELMVDLLDLLDRRAFAEQEIRRIARDELEHEERQCRDDEERRHREKDALGGQPQHVLTR